VTSLGRSSSSVSAQARQLSLLHRLLSERADRGSEHEVLATFADALSIWSDIEVRAYAAALGGGYQLLVALPGSDPRRAPDTLEATVLATSRFRQLAPADRQDLGFPADDEVVLATVAANGPSDWLLAASSQQPLSVETDLQPYVEALERALKTVTAVQTSRLIWAVMTRFIQIEDPAAAADAAVEDISTALGATVEFSLAAAGRSLLTCTFAVHDRAEARDPQKALVTNVAAPPPCTAALTAWPAAGRVLCRNDLQKLEVAGSAFRTWLPHAIRRLETEREGRDPPFEAVIEATTKDAAEHRHDISLALVRFPPGEANADDARRWLETMRGRLRPTDEAGLLTTGEIGIVLRHTSHVTACAVSDRFRRMLSADSVATGRPRATVVVATQSLVGSQTSLLDAARSRLGTRATDRAL